jgi:hypothetical protein
MERCKRICIKMYVLTCVFLSMNLFISLHVCPVAPAARAGARLRAGLPTLYLELLLDVAADLLVLARVAQLLERQHVAKLHNVQACCNYTTASACCKAAQRAGMLQSYKTLHHSAGTLQRYTTASACCRAAQPRRHAATTRQRRHVAKL